MHIFKNNNGKRRTSSDVQIESIGRQDFHELVDEDVEPENLHIQRRAFSENVQKNPFMFCMICSIAAFLCATIIWAVVMLIVFFLDSPGSAQCREYYVNKDMFISTDIDTTFWPSDEPPHLNDTTLNMNDEFMDPNLRLNEVRLFGYHNSYHIQNEKVTIAFWNRLVDNWRYTHPEVLEQLETGNRFFIFDVHIRGDGLMVYHMQVQDQLTRCYCFTECLMILKDWSLAHENHEPMWILFDFKYTLWDDPRPGLSQKDLLAFEQQVLSVFNGSSVLTPDMVRRNDTTLRDAVGKEWPLFNSCRGRAVFVLWTLDPQLTAKYVEGAPNLEHRLMFTVSGDPGTKNTHAVIRRYETSTPGALDNLQSAIDQGFIASGRCDYPGEPSDEHKNRLDASLNSGAQLIYLDFHLPDVWNSMPDEFRNRSVRIYESKIT